MVAIAYLAVFLVFVFSALLLLDKWTSPKGMEKIPGKLGWPIFGESFPFFASFKTPMGVSGFMLERQRRYGKVFKTYVLGRYTLFMSGREASKILLTGKDGQVSLNLFYAGKQVLGPTSILQQNGDAHKRLRRIINEPLSMDSLKRCFPFINKLAMDTLDRWVGRTVLVNEEASAFTLKVIGNLIMSFEPDGVEPELFRANFKLVSGSFASVPLNIPGTTFSRGIKARDRMYAMMDAIIARKRSGEDVRQDFLSSLLLKHSKDGSEEKDDNKLTDSQLKDNILSLMVAGHDTTTATLTWMIKNLEEHPEVLQRLREEHLNIVRNRAEGESTLTWAEVNNMPYTLKVIHESLRYSAVFPWLSRRAVMDFEIGGYKIKKGWSINLDGVTIHQDPEFYPEPEKFNPSRWDEPIKPFTFLGFGSGPRLCPGIHLAKLEMCVFMHHLALRYRWTPLDRDDAVQPILARMPKSRYPVTVESL